MQRPSPPGRLDNKQARRGGNRGRNQQSAAALFLVKTPQPGRKEYIPGSIRRSVVDMHAHSADITNFTGFAHFFGAS